MNLSLAIGTRTTLTEIPATAMRPSPTLTVPREMRLLSKSPLIRQMEITRFLWLKIRLARVRMMLASHKPAAGQQRLLPK